MFDEHISLPKTTLKLHFKGQEDYQRNKMSAEIQMAALTPLSQESHSRCAHTIQDDTPVH